MPRPWRLRFAGAKYHLTQRGNGGQTVFLCADDYQRFLEQLDHCLKANEVTLYAYCLMPNHYHLLVETPLGNVQRFMQRLNTAYAMYFRYKHDRPGHCWQGRYGAKLVKGDDYILRLTRYIHLNPVKVKAYKGNSRAEVLRHLNNWDWSSYGGYAGLKEPEGRINYRWLELMGRAGRRKAYRGYIEEMLSEEDKGFLEENARSGYAIGGQEYRNEVAEELKQKRLERAVTGDVKWPEDGMVGIETIEQAVMKEFGIGHEDLHCHGQHAGIAKSVAVELCCRLSGASQREVGRYFGYRTDGGVSKQRQRLVHKTDKRLVSRIEKLADALSKYIVQV